MLQASGFAHRHVTRLQAEARRIESLGAAKTNTISKYNSTPAPLLRRIMPCAYGVVLEISSIPMKFRTNASTVLRGRKATTKGTPTKSLHVKAHVIPDCFFLFFVMPLTFCKKRSEQMGKTRNSGAHSLALAPPIRVLPESVPWLTTPVLGRNPT